MIKITSLNGKQLYVNAELIATVEATPDTVLTLTTGRKLVITEPVDELLSRFMAYKRRIMGPTLVEGVK